jgi:hypothetical protein
MNPYRFQRITLDLDVNGAPYRTDGPSGTHTRSAVRPAQTGELLATDHRAERRAAWPGCDEVARARGVGRRKVQNRAFHSASWAAGRERRRPGSRRGEESCRMDGESQSRPPVASGGGCERTFQRIAEANSIGQSSEPATNLQNNIPPHDSANPYDGSRFELDTRKLHVPPLTTDQGLNLILENFAFRRPAGQA